MTNMNKLRGKIIEQGKTIEEIADILSIDRSTIYRKIADNGDTFTVKQVNVLMEVLNLSAEELSRIFFNRNVA